MRHVFAFSILTTCAVPVWANEAVDQLTKVMRLTEVAEILRDEGLRYGDVLDADMLGGEGGEYFRKRVAEIYATDRMVETMRHALSEEMSVAELSHSVTFFGSELGQTIVSLENSARRAFGDPTVEEMARNRASELDESDPKYQLVIEYIEVNDLVAQNVQGGISSDFAFYRGLSTLSDVPRDDEAVLADLLEGREESEQETREWLFGFLLLAYQPLTEPEMRDNIDFSMTQAGQALNAALFKGFDTLYNSISFELGQAVAFEMTASDL